MTLTPSIFTRLENASSSPRTRCARSTPAQFDLSSVIGTSERLQPRLKCCLTLRANMKTAMRNRLYNRKKIVAAVLKFTEDRLLDLL